MAARVGRFIALATGIVENMPLALPTELPVEGSRHRGVERRGAKGAPGGTVSTPLTWDEVGAGKVRPGRFTMETIFERLDKVGDLFDGVVLHSQDLKPALDTFGVKASRDDISRGRVRKRVPAKKRRRSA